MAVAIIGGTGVYDLVMLADRRPDAVTTPYGEVRLQRGRYGPLEVLFLPRHGAGHAYRRTASTTGPTSGRCSGALGAERVLATGAVGSLRPAMRPGDFVLVDQFLDFTKGRPATFHDEEGQGVVHVDVTTPYCPQLRELLGEAAGGFGIPVHHAGTYVCTEGPRYESPAEIRMFAQLGGDVVGMTGLPEVVLAREKGLCYGLVAMVTNRAAGLAGQPLTHEEVKQVMGENAERLRRLLARALEAMPGERACGCASVPEAYGA